MRDGTSPRLRPKSIPGPAKFFFLSLLLTVQAAEARNFKELAQGAAIGAGIAVLVDGGSGVLSGATAGLLVTAISRRGNNDNRK